MTQPPGETQWPPPPPGAESRQTNGVAVAALVVGIVALLMFPFGLILGTLAVVLAVVGLRRTRDPAMGGTGLAVAGLITGAVSLLLGLTLVLGLVAAVQNPEVRAVWEEMWDAMRQAEDPEEVEERLEELEEELENEFE